MLGTLLQILSCYLVLIGTWRLANATGKAPVGSELQQHQKAEETYNPLKDLMAIWEVIAWMADTVKNFSKPGHFSDAVIFHKKFSWGLFWLMLGILLQFLLYAFEK